MDTSINFNEKKGFICDMDGVIYHGNRVLPGVVEFIPWLHDEDKEYLFLTNNSGYTPVSYTHLVGGLLPADALRQRDAPEQSGMTMK